MNTTNTTRYDSEAQCESEKIKPLHKSLFVCEDDPDGRELLRFAFELDGWTVTDCDDAQECLEQARAGNFQAIILDNRIGATSTVEVCREIRNIHRTLPIVFYSAEARKAEIDKALAAGADDYLVKPLDFERLPDVVNRLIAKSLTQTI